MSETPFETLIVERVASTYRYVCEKKYKTKEAIKDIVKDISKIGRTLDKILIGIYNFGSRDLSDSSLNYLDYIIKVVGKSCKSASIIIVAILFVILIIKKSPVYPLHLLTINRKQCLYPADNHLKIKP